ncbi:CRISPR-associated endonuclease Cas2 [Geosporobacter ferrireducens]|uniref:CRISPR-associated endoribonuclease Cas2 n=1 Tax=Geosporobacter ferrireducens TaxID=1424294 RepID=A0A1D8GJ48_9FIRM|nr:CRISPR-associated endonuclease Cas2 [Geosporobacter ferrireducens]AOT70862.1 CRISPR-associated endonuclease Cas2 [Geosporobacter ferrireducens]MTI53567.1 CRISPR-associated endonuclease Cas2 [Geosporobacter ferrireducens]
MFVIVTYDVGEKRVNKVRKHLKKYLIWVQNSVFEGEITEGKLEKCLMELSRKINKHEDSIYVYKIKIPSQITKDIIGEEKNVDDMFL